MPGGGPGLEGKFYPPLFNIHVGAPAGQSRQAYSKGYFPVRPSDLRSKLAQPHSLFVPFVPVAVEKSPVGVPELARQLSAQALHLAERVAPAGKEPVAEKNVEVPLQQREALVYLFAHSYAPFREL